MASPQWPKADKRLHIGKPYDRLDGPIKSTGQAKYAYDVNVPGMLYAKVFPSRYALADVNSIDTSAAEAMDGVKAVWIDEGVLGKEVRYVGQIIAAVAAETEELAAEAIALVKVDYTPKEALIIDTDPSLGSGRPSEREEGTPAEAFEAADVVHEGYYGIPVITHCCFEAHGQVCDVNEAGAQFWPSTQNVSKYANGMGESLGVPESEIKVDCQVMGGGFGSKFGHDKWGVVGGLLSKKAGRPVKLMLERDLELMVGGNRPSAYGTVKVGADKDGNVTAIDAKLFGTGGNGGYRPPPVPYVFTKIPNQLSSGQRIQTNRGGQRAWRAPGHPQGCFITMAAMEDTAAKLGMDALDFFKQNLALTNRPELYAQELDIAADMIGYKEKAHLRGDSGDGPVKRGLGISIHQWGGAGHPSECDVSIHADGSVECRIGTQDLGVGTRTCVTMVLAETMGLPMDAVKANIGNNAYPISGASGGSTTIGGVSSSTRLAATAALNKLLDVVAARMGEDALSLEASNGRIQVTGDDSKSVTWNEACAMLGTNSINERGVNEPGESTKMGLMDSGVGGCQMADVSVDIETGVVTINEMVAVQDCGLIIDMKTATTQVHGGLIMGVTYALFEECVYDNRTGRMLNADMEFYRLAGLKDIGTLKVHMMTGPGFDERGVIGLGEPPVISPGAAISNAVANAIGLRVPELPLTPDRVLNAIAKGGQS